MLLIIKLIFLISETKMDDLFPTVQFLIEGFGIPYRHNRSSKGGELLLYIPEDILSKRFSWKSDYNWNYDDWNQSYKKKVVFECILQSQQELNFASFWFFEPYFKWI